MTTLPFLFLPRNRARSFRPSPRSNRAPRYPRPANRIRHRLALQEPITTAFNRNEAESHMIFRKGVHPGVEVKLPSGEYAINVRYRAEFAVPSKDFGLWAEAWQTTVFAIVDESLDPDDFIVGAEIKVKEMVRGAPGGSNVLRLDISFSKEDKDVCDAICGELSRLIKAKVPGMSIFFVRRVPRSEIAACFAARMAAHDTSRYHGGGSVAGAGAGGGAGK